MVENESDLLIVPLRAPSITGGALRICYAGQPCGMTFQVTGSPAPGISFSGTLPAGMVNVGGGTLLGIPAAGATGTYPIAVTAANAMGAVTQEFTIVVRPGTEWFRPPPTRPAPVLLPRMTTLPRGGEDA